MNFLFSKVLDNVKDMTAFCVSKFSFAKIHNDSYNKILGLLDREVSNYNFTFW